VRTSQTLNLELSEKRGELATVTATLNKAAADGNDPAAEDIGKADTLTREIRALEVRYRAAILTEEQEDAEARAEGDIDPETRELMALETRATISAYVAAAMETRAVNGAELEYNQALKLGADKFPLSLLAPPEQRQTTDAEIQTTPRRWLDRLFAETAASALGITMESVAAGVMSYPLTTAGAGFAMKERQAAIGDAAWTIGTTEAKPKRGGVRLRFTMEDTARVPGLESALERDLRAAMTEGVDRAIFLGADGGAANTADITGLQTAAITEITLTQANKVKADKVLEAFAGFIDGLYATGFGDLNVVTSVGAWRLWATTIANAAAENQTLAEFLRAGGLSYRAREGIDVATAAGDFGAYVGLGRGITGAGVAAVWDAGTLVRDPYSEAAQGTIALTLNYLWDFQLPRPANFRRLKFVA